MKKEKFLLGWREWVALPELSVQRLKCKVDTGARTSSLHAFYVEPYDKNGLQKVRFGLHPVQKDNDTEIHCNCELIDIRDVTDSGGHREKRYVIKTNAVIGPWTLPIELTLTNRDTMQFRMLLGRRAIRDLFIVDPSRSYQADKKKTIIF